MITRRDTLRSMAALGLAGALPAHALAATADTDKRLIVVVLRGGMDGLGAVPAIGDPAFMSIRAGLGDGSSMRTGPVNRLDSTFGLHPMLRQAHGMWQDGDLAIAHAVHSPARNRSHFDSQDLLETGLDHVSSTADGWINRALGWYETPSERMGLATGYGMPLIMRGSEGVRVWSPRRLPEAEPTLLTALGQMGSVDPAFRAAVREGADSVERDQAILHSDGHTDHASTRDLIAIQQLARATGKFLADPQGPRIATFDIGGWDTHGSQNIYFSYRLPVLDGALAALKDSLGDTWQDTAIAVVTEFGRTVRPNGTTGTDHGTATAALIAGGAVKGGKVHADWPGLKPADLHENRDLRPTMDIRSVFKALLTQHMGMDPGFVERSVFPGSESARAIPGLT
jgi:uncharacterized protein (DUF1501 family)